jgi:hypothetical protein
MLFWIEIGYEISENDDGFSEVEEWDIWTRK